MKNAIDKKGQKQGIWQMQNKAKTLLIEESYKNGIIHGKRTETYKEDWFREQFYMNGQLFGETLRNDKLIIQKFHEIIDNIPSARAENKQLDFWSVFELEFDMNYDRELREFVSGQIKIYYDIRGR